METCDPGQRNRHQTHAPKPQPTRFAGENRCCAHRLGTSTGSSTYARSRRRVLRYRSNTRFCFSSPSIDRMAGSRKGVRQHRGRMPQSEQWIVKKRRGKMLQLYPAFGPPPQKLDIRRRNVFRSHNGGRPIIVGHVFVHDEALIAELLSHRGSRVRCRMLNVRPVDVPLGKFKIRLD